MTHKYNDNASGDMCLPPLGLPLSPGPTGQAHWWLVGPEASGQMVVLLNAIPGGLGKALAKPCPLCCPAPCPSRFSSLPHPTFLSLYHCSCVFSPQHFS